MKFDLGWKIQFYIISELCFWIFVGWMACIAFDMPYWYISLWLGMIAVAKTIQTRWELNIYSNTFLKLIEKIVVVEEASPGTVKDK